MKTDQTNTRLQIVRLIRAPRAQVYAAWTDPALMKQWFGPDGGRTENLVLDARVGGQFRWDLTDADGEAMTMLGEFRELEPGRKISFTWQWQDDEDWADHVSVVTVELSDHANGTEVRLTHENLPTEKSRDGHNRGWNIMLDKVEEFLSKP